MNNELNDNTLQPIDVTDWTQGLRLPQPQVQLFSECLKSLPEDQRLLPAKKLQEAIARGQVKAVPAAGKPVAISMLTDAGKVEKCKLTDYWITRDGDFATWLQTQVQDTIYHLIRTTGQPAISAEDIHSGRIDLAQAQTALQHYLRHQPKRKPVGDEANKLPKKRRRIQPPVTPAEVERESETRE